MKVSRGLLIDYIALPGRLARPDLGVVGVSSAVPTDISYQGFSRALTPRNGK